MTEPSAAITAAYVHIPFCVRKCSYCDFVSFAGQTAAEHTAYCLALRREIAALGDHRQLETVFIGCGTPTILPSDQLAAILQSLEQAFGLAADGEYTLEANPGTVTLDGLIDCRQAGFNRISFGLQAIQPHILSTLGRIHSSEDFTASVAMAVKAGFQSINADIMFGLPDQTLADVAATVNFLLSQPIDHVSFYSLSLEDGTPLQAVCEQEPERLPSEETERAQYNLIRQTLQEAGFEHYEISNAARPGRQCRHNLVYWQARSYYGFGAAAHSLIQGIRRANTTDLKAYLDVWRPGGRGDQDPFAAANTLEILDQNESRKEVMLLGLRLLAGVSDNDFQARFGSSLTDCFGTQIEHLVSRGLLNADRVGVRLTPLGLDLANQVFMEFV